MVLEAHDLTKEFEYPKSTQVLKGISFDVPTKSSVSITGPSGSGKSTLLNILGLLESPSSGSVKILGLNKPAHQIRNEHIGFIFQSFHLNE